MERKTTLSQEELIMFCKEMNLILSSSIGIVDGFGSVIGGMKHKEVREALEVSLDALENNQQLSVSLERSGLFSPYMISMIEIGEKTGKVDQVMESLAVYYEKDARLKRQIRSSMVYPLVVAGMVTVIIGVMVTKVLPIFADVFQSLGGSLPSSVDLVTGVGRVLVAVVLAIFLALMILVGTLLLLYRTPSGKQKARKIFGRLPHVRDIYRRYLTAQFANSLSLLVSSGYDLHDSLEMTEKIIEDEVFEDKIKKAIAAFETGEPLHKVLEDMDIFAGVHARMVRLSIRTGHLDSVLADLSDKYTENVDHSIGTLIGVIEPTLVGATSFIIGGILLTVMLPLLRIMSSMG
ncbi:MAG: type II secretion system F family protein [Peptostreptococcaceae bacterium]|nr:type II secretion system F family protein [Peptostreptococcaceae bacterium]